MPYSWRLLRPVLLVAMLLALAVPLVVPVTYAQDDETVTIQGSLQAEALLSMIREAYLVDTPDASIVIDAQGPSQGFSALCTGEADIVMSTEPISDSQMASCNTRAATFIETVIAYEAVALLAAPDAELVCLNRDLVDTFWSLGAPADVSWADLGSTTLDSTVTFYGPDDASSAFRLFASLVPAGELRENITTTGESAAIPDKVLEENSNALAYMSLADFDALGLDADILPLDIGDADGQCVPLDQISIEDGSYPLMRTFYLYINGSSAQKPAVQAFLDFTFTNEDAGAPAAAAEQGYTVPGASIFEADLANVENNRVGRTFTRPLTPVDLVTTADGAVTVGGSSMLYSLISPIANNFTQTFTNADIQIDPLGNTPGWAAFCTGELDVLQATREATADELALCEENGVDPYVIDLGYEALVLSVAPGNDWVDCINGEQVAALLSAGTDDSPAPLLWSDVDAAWPETSLLLVVPPLNTGETDYLMVTLAGDLSAAIRSDMIEDNDPLYRVQGVANTAQDEANPNNGFTYLYWSDFQASEADVRLLAVNDGGGCVVPTPETFAYGSYALSFPVRYYFDKTAMNDNAMVRAFLWHFFSDNTLDRLAGQGYEGLDVDTLGTTEKDAVFEMLAGYENQPPADADASEDADAPAE
ncbi:MAG: substrate-binding domain-containing protein [Anaerolineae bacterium]|nr:substrate-binding domain-containing protein [Anaerolineae bacterium]